MPNTRYLLGILRYLYCSNQCIQRSTCLAPVQAVEDELALSSGSPEIYSTAKKESRNFKLTYEKCRIHGTIQESFKRILEP